MESSSPDRRISAILTGLLILMSFLSLNIVLSREASVSAFAALSLPRILKIRLPEMIRLHLISTIPISLRFITLTYFKRSLYFVLLFLEVVRVAVTLREGLGDFCLLLILE